jgi:hypothetical protein
MAVRLSALRGGRALLHSPGPSAVRRRITSDAPHPDEFLHMRHGAPAAISCVTIESNLYLSAAVLAGCEVLKGKLAAGTSQILAFTQRTYLVTCQGKVNLSLSLIRHIFRRTYGEVEAYIHTFLTSAVYASCHGSLLGGRGGNHPVSIR